MGMSASQARLLSITSRLSDTEYKGQKVANDKIRLGNDSEQIYANYLEALQGKKFQINVWDDNQGKQVQKDLTLALLESSGYRITTKDGVVATEPAENARPASYFSTNSASSGSEISDEPVQTEEDELYSSATLTPTLGALTNATISDTDATLVGEESSTASSRFGSFTSANLASTSSNVYTRTTDITSATTAESNSTVTNRTLGSLTQASASVNLVNSGATVQVNNALTNNSQTIVNNSTTVNTGATTQITNTSPTVNTRPSVSEIINSATEVEEEDSSELRPYTEGEELYVRLKEDPSYLTSALEAGYILLQTQQENGDGSYEWSNVSVSATDDISQVTDDSDVAIAEAQYSADMAKLNTKEERLDMELTKINTEHNALQTEYDSVKQVISKNQDRTFKLFS